MIRLLIIGRNAERWREHLSGWAGKTIDVVTETLPAAGLRSFAEDSPDAVAIAEPDRSPKLTPIVEAIRERPLGQIVPVLALGGTPPDGEGLDIAAAVAEEEGGEELIRELAAILEIDLESEPRHAQATSEPNIEIERREGDDEGPTLVSTEIPTMRDGARASESPSSERARRSGTERVDHRDYVIEPIDEAESAPAGTESPSTGSRVNTSPVEPPDTAEIRRKLKEVRHEDYFVILDVSRSADVEAVRQAYRGLKARFRTDNIDIHLAEKFEAELDEINDALDDARAVLGDESLREAYLNQTTRQ